jgi:hypothetical protein
MSAIFSPCKKYRYWLSRQVFSTYGLARSRAVWIMLNPSIAGAIEDDPTIGRVTDFSFQFGFDIFGVVNLFALISPYPKALTGEFASLSVGENNNRWITRAVNNADTIICAWGAFPGAVARGAEVVRQIRKLHRTPMCLGRNKNGSPKHPLYLPASTKLQEYT